MASLAPPPFPFTAFVMAAAALQYSRLRLLAVVGITRLVRFMLLGALAMRFGERILKWGKNPIRSMGNDRADRIFHRRQRGIGVWMDPPQPKGACKSGLGDQALSSIWAASGCVPEVPFTGYSAARGG